MSELILLTGANGFVGSAVGRMLSNNSKNVKAVLREPAKLTFAASGGSISVDIDAQTDWSGVFEGVTTIIHTAARVHIMNDQSTDPLVEFRRVNVEGTLNLARQAAVAGVKRFIFISSIKVNGESTQLDRPYHINDNVDPTDPYGISKWEAEKGLQVLAKDTGMDMVIIRPPLVYGPGVKANFFTMMLWLCRGVPLPLGAIHNKRSLVALDNLVDLIVTCIDHPKAANQSFFVSDGEDLSISQLLHRLGNALGRPARLVPVPAGVVKFSANLLGKKEFAVRLCGSLQVDINKTCELLSWSPPIKVDQALRETANDFLNGRH